MSNDFINRREYDNRRRRSSSSTISGEVIQIADFDTFIWYTPSNLGGDRWSAFPNAVLNSTSASSSRQIPIGLLNPWNHSDGLNFLTESAQGVAAPIAPRTPTRGIFGFNLQGLTTGASIVDATLSLTTAGISWWDQLGAGEVAAGAGGGGNAGGGGGSAFVPVAQEDITTKIWVAYNFDGSIAPIYPSYRAVSWGGDNPAFSWFKFVNGVYPFPGADGYNPHPGRDHPWSLKAWYKWGARQFHIHMPFGRPYVVTTPQPGFENYEHLAYQADAYMCAAEGFYDDASNIFYNMPMPNLVADFESIWKSLISGQQHCTNAEWQALLEWFNPLEPIRVIAYNGSISKWAETTENQYPRWSRLFDADYNSALARLKSSVQPYINCGMQIAIDALTAAPGSVPGQFIPTSELSANAQKGWWEFFTWLKTTVGEKNLYCEAHPMKRTNLITGSTDPNPYIGLNVMSSEDWSYFPATTVPFHTMHELSSVNYLRCTYWGSVGPKTRRLNPYLSQARYFDIDDYAEVADDGERRINKNSQQTYFGTAFEHIYLARNIKDRYDQEGDSLPEYNITKPGYLMNPLCLQEYPSNWGIGGTQRFIDRFPNISYLAAYINSYNSPPLPTTTTATGDQTA